MKAGMEVFRNFDQDAKDNAAFQTTQLTMPMIVLGGEKSGGDFLITQGKMVAREDSMPHSRTGDTRALAVPMVLQARSYDRSANPATDLNQRLGSDQEQVCVPHQANDPSCCLKIPGPKASVHVGHG
jgi:hypothetical protein